MKTTIIHGFEPILIPKRPKSRRSGPRGIKTARRHKTGRNRALRHKKHLLLLVVVGSGSFILGALTTWAFHHWATHILAGLFDGLGIAILEAIVGPWLE